MTTISNNKKKKWSYDQALFNSVQEDMEYLFGSVFSRKRKKTAQPSGSWYFGEKNKKVGIKWELTPTHLSQIA